MTREQMIDEAVRRTFRAGKLIPLTSQRFKPMNVYKDIAAAVRAEFRLVVKQYEGRHL